MSACYCILAGTAACNNCPNRPMTMDVTTDPFRTNLHLDNKTVGDQFDMWRLYLSEGVGSPATTTAPITKEDLLETEKLILEIEIASGTRLNLAVYWNEGNEFEVFRLPEENDKFLKFLWDIKDRGAKDVKMLKLDSKYYEDDLQE